jgi:hypothetical protein
MLVEALAEHVRAGRGETGGSRAHAYALGKHRANPRSSVVDGVALGHAPTIAERRRAEEDLCGQSVAGASAWATLYTSRLASMTVA